MIIFSDLHLDRDSADVCLNEILPGICNAAINSDCHVVFLGDWWHLRYRVDVRLQVAVRDELLRWGDLGVVLEILVGNHDQVNLAGRNALEVFDDLPNVKVYSEPMFWDECAWLPYRRDLSAYDSMMDRMRDRTVFVHQVFRGAWMNDGCQAQDGLNAGAFAGARVFAGHYHRRQPIPSRDAEVWYVGSPRQVTAAEAGQAKGFCVVEGKSIDFVDTKWGPRFHRIKLEPGQSLPPMALTQGDDVRVTVATEAECARVGAELDSLGVKHTVTPAVQSSEVRYAVEGISGVRGYADAWVREHGRDGDQLMQTYDSLVG